jgi:hypothetical protein
MKVKELIDILKQYQDDQEVLSPLRSSGRYQADTICSVVPVFIRTDEMEERDKNIEKGYGGVFRFYFLREGERENLKSSVHRGFDGKTPYERCSIKAVMLDMF